MTIAYHAPAHPGMSYPVLVDPKPPPRDPPQSGGGRPAFPRLGDRLVRPETREEMVRGRLVLAPPANPPHAERHHTVDYVTGAALAPGYIGASDLLTRTSVGSDFATDTCIRREGVDPETGERYLEELAFEIVGEQTLRDITERAADLTARGVRRVIAIFAKSNEVREWSAELDDWLVLDPSSVLDDRTLAQPIPIRALLDRAEANRAVVRALYAKQEPELMAIEAKGRRDGLEQGRRDGLEQGRRNGLEQGRRNGLEQGIAALCKTLGIPLLADRRATMQALDVSELEALLATLGNEHRWP